MKNFTILIMLISVIGISNKTKAQCNIADQTVSASATHLCANESTTIQIASSETGVNYYLRNDSDNSIIDGPIAGTGSDLNFLTGNLTSTTSFNVYAEEINADALLFDASNSSYIDCGTNDRGITTTLTVSAWVKTTFAGAQPIIVKDDGSAGFNLSQDANGKAVFNVKFSNGTSYETSGASSTSINDGNWHFVTGVLDVADMMGEASLIINIDGINEALNTIYPGDNLGTGINLYIGKAGSNYFTGEMDEISIWNFYKSQSQIQAYMNECLTGTEQDLTGAFHLTNNSDWPTCTDVTSTENGTYTNFPPSGNWNTGIVSCNSTCNQEMSQIITIEIGPATPELTGNFQVCPGETSILGVNNTYSSYQWYKDAVAISGATNSTYNATPDHSYQVYITDAYGCTAYSNSETVQYFTTEVPPVEGNLEYCPNDSTQLNSQYIYSNYLWSNGATTQSTYFTISDNPITLTVVDNNGCSVVSNTINLSEFLTMPAPVITGELDYCANSSTQLSSQDTYSSYSWSNGATAQNSNFTVADNPITLSVIDDNNGCSVVSNAVNVIENALPTPTITENGYILETESFDSYQWYFNGSVINGATNQTYTATQTGDYSVEVTDNNSCTNFSQEVNVTITNINSLPNNEFSIYPNPSNGDFIIKFNKITDANIIIYDITGKVVLTKNRINKNINISLKNINKGMYFVKINNKNNTAIEKVIIK